MLMRVCGMLMRLLAKLVRREMVPFALGGGGVVVGVGSQVVQLCDSIMGALWHSVLQFPQMRFLQTRGVLHRCLLSSSAKSSARA